VSFKKGNPVVLISGKRIIDGIERHYPSRMEANMHRYYIWLRDVVGELKEVEYQPEPFVFTTEEVDEKGHWRYVRHGCPPTKKGKRVKAVLQGHTIYKPDFRLVLFDDSLKIVETIGYRRPDHGVRLRRMAKFYPDVSIDVVDWARYKALNKQLKNIISGWEVTEVKKFADRIRRNPRTIKARTRKCK